MKFFSNLFGEREKESVATPPELTSVGKKILTQRGFKLTEYSDKNMWKYYEWTNSDFQFSLTYDRGYYDSDICPLGSTPDLRMRLVPLLKFLRNDKNFYNKQLKEFNLLNTLTPDGFILLLDDNFDLVKRFINDFDTDKFESYKNFKFDYDGI